MKKVNKNMLITMIDEMDKKYIAFDDERNALVVSATLDDLKEFSINRAVEIYQYEDSREKRSFENYRNIDFVFKSNVMKKTIELVETIAATDTTVLVQGETGTGKSFIAKLIHMNSDRKDQVFMDINCAAIPEKLLESELFGYEPGAFTGALDMGKPGLFEAAGKGTVFLDEINSLPMQLQVKILRVIQEKEVMRIGGSEYIPIKARVIAASNRDLQLCVDEGTFRSDLYYRLNIVPITVPALRNRSEDIRELADYFLQRYNNKYGQNKYLSEGALKKLEKYNWPGNVRELENMIERVSIVSLSNKIDESEFTELFSKLHLDERFSPNIKTTLKEEMENYEKKYIEAKMETCKTTAELARLLGIDKSTLTRKIKKLGIKR